MEIHAAAGSCILKVQNPHPRTTRHPSRWLAWSCAKRGC